MHENKKIDFKIGDRVYLLDKFEASCKYDVSITEISGKYIDVSIMSNKYHFDGFNLTWFVDYDKFKEEILNILENKEHFENMEDYLENKEYKYTIGIFNYKGSAPQIVIYDREFQKVENYFLEINIEILKNWLHETWFFKDKKYGFHKFKTDDLDEFLEHLKNY